MTTEELKTKIERVKAEIDKVDRKRASLSIQRENLQIRLKRLLATQPKDPKVPSDEEKKLQSSQDRERFAQKLQERLENGGFDSHQARKISRMHLEKK